MSTSLVFYGLLASHGAIVSNMAHEAKVAACKTFIHTFDAQHATVEQMQAYAECMHVVYPQVMAGGYLMAAKMLVLLMIAGAVIGVWYANYREPYYELGERVLISFIGAIIGSFMLPAGFAAVLCFLYGIYWVFS